MCSEHRSATIVSAPGVLGECLSGILWLLTWFDRRRNDTVVEAHKMKNLHSVSAPAKAASLWQHCSRCGGRNTVTQAALCCSEQQMRE